jgi:hypothetical protein
MNPHIETIIIIILFSIIYLYCLFRETARQNLDIYDFIMLSTVGVFPMVFAIIPRLAEIISNFIGVKYPFVVLFGVLIALLFIFIHRLTRKIHRLENAYRNMLQDLCIMEEQLSRNLKNSLKTNGNIK